MVDDPRPRTPWGAFVAMAMIVTSMNWASIILRHTHSVVGRGLLGAYLFLGVWLLWERWRSLPRRKPRLRHRSS